MELSLSIGETHKLCMGSFSSSTEDEKRNRLLIRENDQKYSSSDSFIPPHFSPLHIHYSRLSFPCLHQNPNLICEAGNGYSSRVGRKVRDEADQEEEEGATGSSSSPNTTISSFRGMYDDDDDKSKRNNYVSKRHNSGSDEEEENGMAGRKKLRLTKDQSAFLEDSFKQHNTLNPKQKIGLAKQLSLRPRQVEVWFQNRRARTKLKQTEVDCEYLKRCCETLTEEKRKLQKELLELRTLKSAASNMQLPATTLTICPSCQRVASTTSVPLTASSAPTKPILHAFLQDHAHALQPS